MTHHEIVWALHVVIPKLALLIILLHLALVTRRVNIGEFKQTKPMNILIFGDLILNGICVSLFISLRSIVSWWAVSVSYVSISLMCLGPVVLCIILILLPPLIPPIKEGLLKNSSPKGTTSWSQISHAHQ